MTPRPLPELLEAIDAVRPSTGAERLAAVAPRELLPALGAAAEARGWRWGVASSAPETRHHGRYFAWVSTGDDRLSDPSVFGETPAHALAAALEKTLQPFAPVSGGPA